MLELSLSVDSGALSDHRARIETLIENGTRYIVVLEVRGIMSMVVCVSTFYLLGSVIPLVRLLAVRKISPHHICS